MSMKATYNLRRLLDERGVEWWSQRFPDDDDSTIVTYWNGFIEGEPWGVWELWDFDGRLFIEFNNDRDFPITPEQVVEATLGRGKCHLEINTSMTAVVCDRCNYPMPHGTVLTEVRFCPNCGRKVLSA